MVIAWHGRSMTSVNQLRPHCVNQMGNTRSKPLAARHGRGTAWARHAMCDSAFMRSYALIIYHAVREPTAVWCGPPEIFSIQLARTYETIPSNRLPPLLLYINRLPQSVH